MARVPIRSALCALLFLFVSGVASASTVHATFLSRQADIQFSGTSPGDLVAAVQAYSYSLWAVQSPASAFVINGTPSASALQVGQEGTVTAYDGDAGGVWDVSCYVVAVDSDAPSGADGTPVTLIQLFVFGSLLAAVAAGYSNGRRGM